LRSRTLPDNYKLVSSYFQLTGLLRFMAGKPIDLF